MAYDPDADLRDGRQAAVTAEKDPGGVSNCYQFTIQNEDHTLGNLLTQKLLDEDRVLFAGYRIHHPMDDWIYVRVNVSDDIQRPADLVQQTIQTLTQEIDILSDQFAKAVKGFMKGADSGRSGY
jgi:DNA-directed RNA polymerase II subunit RPB11